MMSLKSSIAWIIACQLVLTPMTASAAIGRHDDRQESREEQREKNRKADRHENRKDDRQDDRKDDRRYVKPRHVNKKHVVVVPRKRSYRNIIVVRPHGHAYAGYGHHHHDDDAWKWLAFTAITLKLLDNLNEQAQREHEAAQVKATTAPVGEKIMWETDDSSGYVVTTKQGSTSDGLTCREFQQEITVGGKTEEAYGTACLQADGSWKIVD